MEARIIAGRATVLLYKQKVLPTPFFLPNRRPPSLTVSSSPNPLPLVGMSLGPLSNGNILIFGPDIMAFLGLKKWPVPVSLSPLSEHRHVTANLPHVTSSYRSLSLSGPSLLPAFWSPMVFPLSRRSPFAVRTQPYSCHGCLANYVLCV